MSMLRRRQAISKNSSSGQTNFSKQRRGGMGALRSVVRRTSMSMILPAFKKPVKVPTVDLSLDNNLRRHRGQAPIEELFRTRFQVREASFWGIFDKACLAGGDSWVTFRGLMLAYSLPQEINGKDDRGETMMTLAAQFGRPHIITILHFIKGNFTTCNTRGWTPLHAAVAYHRIEVVKKIHQLGGSLHIQGPGLGHTAAHLAVQSNNVEMLQVLDELDTDFSVTSHTGATLLHVAAEYDALECARYLMTRHSSLLSVVDHMLETPGHKAARLGHSTILHLCYQHGISIHLENIEEDTIAMLAEGTGQFQRSVPTRF